MSIRFILLWLALVAYMAHPQSFELLGQGTSSTLDAPEHDLHQAESIQNEPELSFNHPTDELVDKALESGLTIFSYNLEAMPVASNPWVKYVMQLTHWMELLPARAASMLFILVNNLRVYVEKMNALLEPAMQDVHLMLGRNSSTYPLARTICLLLFAIYSSILPLLSLFLHFFSHALERSVTGLTTYQGLNLLLWLVVLAPASLLYKLSRTIFPRRLALRLSSAMDRLAGVLLAILLLPWHLLKAIWRAIERVFLAIVGFVASLFGRRSAKKKLT